MTAAAFQATYSDWRLVRSRKVCQVVLEIPLEQATQVLDCLGGMPNPASEVWVGVARLKTEKGGDANSLLESEPVHTGNKTPPASADKPARAPRPFTSLPLPQQAALLCQDPAFWKYMKPEAQDESDAANFVRNYCGVTSRRQLESNIEASTLFVVLREKFLAWKALAA